MFVNGRPKQAILQVLQQRLPRDTDAELREGLQAMMAIARDRLKKRSAL